MSLKIGHWNVLDKCDFRRNLLNRVRASACVCISGEKVNVEKQLIFPLRRYRLNERIQEHFTDLK